MPKYMVQSVESGTLGKITYYRKQTQDHVSHDESGRFTQDAQARYRTDKNLAGTAAVELGSYKSGQGVPSYAATEI